MAVILRLLRRVLLAFVLLGTTTARAAPPAPPLEDDYDRLGRLERQAVDAVLAERELTVDRAPAGKTIGEIVVATRPVFAEREGFLTFFNLFHVTTRERIIRRELLFATGEPWDQSRVDETLRNVRDPLYHNVVVILPVVSPSPGTVDVLVVTRDVWSLRLNSRWDVQGLEIINLTLSLSENNLFGLRKRLAASFLLDQGTVQLGPSYIDPNIAGTRLTLRSAWRFVFARDDGDFEGTRSESVLAYPLWSLRSRWAGSLSVSHSFGFDRRFLGNELRPYDAPETEAVETLPWIYRRRDLATEAQVARAFGSRVRQTVGVGHELALQRPALIDEFPEDPVLREAFTRDVLPRSELASAIFAAWELYTPVYGAYRDLDTFDFREDYQLGPLVTARATFARQELGSDRDFVRLSAGARWSSGWRKGLWRVAAGASVRLEDGRAIDKSPSLSMLLATPQLGRFLRVLVYGALDWIVDDEGNRLFALGGSNGLRGYAVNAFVGDARALGHLELRTRPLRIEFFRLGAVLFWDLGHAADTLAELRLHHAVGAGLRTLIPQLDPLVIRVDWAFALSGSSAGWPGRFILGVEQVF